MNGIYENIPLNTILGGDDFVLVVLRWIGKQKLVGDAARSTPSAMTRVARRKVVPPKQLR